MNGFITIKEASQLVGKHPDTIRRLIKDNKNSKNVAKDRKGRVILSADWIVSCFDLTEAPVTNEIPKVEPTPIATSSGTTDLVIETLRSQLEAKDQQIANLHKLLSDKEDNTTKLQDQFQHLLATKQIEAGVQEATQVAYEAPMQTGVEVVNEVPNKPTPVKKPKAKKATKKKPSKVVADVKPVKKKRWWSK